MADNGNGNGRAAAGPRVVVTGLGALTPIGNSPDDYWRNLVAGRLGHRPDHQL